MFCLSAIAYEPLHSVVSLSAWPSFPCSLPLRRRLTARGNSKPAPLNALTGLRCFAALNIVFFHFSNPQWFGLLTGGQRRLHLRQLLHPAVGFCAWLQLHRSRAQRGTGPQAFLGGALHPHLSHLFFSLILSLGQLEVGIPKPHARHVLGGVVLTPLFLQGPVPAIATFLNTPAWTMSAEAFYLIFPWLRAIGRARNVPLLTSRKHAGSGCWLPSNGLTSSSIQTASRTSTAGATAHGSGRSNIPRIRTCRALSSVSCWQISTR